MVRKVYYYSGIYERGRLSFDGSVCSEGKIHLQKWQPEAWNDEKFLKGGCHYG